MTTTLDKIRWRKELDQRGYERNLMSPELAEALRREIRTALEADGGSFDINVARRVYDLAIAARDMCVAATSSVKEAINQIKDTNGPVETLDASDTPASQVQISESFGARLLRELMATLPMLRQPRESEDPKQLVHALADARRNGMHDVAEQLEVKLFGRVLSGPRPIAAEEVEVIEGSFTHGFADGRAGALPVSEAGEYHEGYLKGATAKFLAAHEHDGEIEKPVEGQLPSEHPIRLGGILCGNRIYVCACGAAGGFSELTDVNHAELLQRAEAKAEADCKAASMNVMNGAAP
jgi:hypothetical protein